MPLTNYCVVPLVKCSTYYMFLTPSWQKNSKPRAVKAICVSTVCGFFFFTSLLVAALQNTANIKEQNRTVSSALCLQPDVLFRDEFGSLHSAIVIYIGSAWTNEVFFPLLNAKTKTEGGGSYLQFGASIKMLIVGNHFSAVTMEALSLQRPKTARRMDPPESTTQNSLSLNWNTHRKIHRERERGERGISSFQGLLYIYIKKMFSYAAMAVTLAPQEQMLDWPHVGGVTVDVRSGPRSVNQ